MERRQTYEIEKPIYEGDIYTTIKRIGEIEQEFELNRLVDYKVEGFVHVFVWVDLKKGWVTSYDGNTTVTIVVLDNVEMLAYLKSMKSKFELDADVWTCDIDDRIKELKILMDSKKKNAIKIMRNGNTEIKVGTLLYTSWGYDQTNVEMFRVEKLLGKTYFIIQQIKLALTEKTTMTADEVVPTYEVMDCLPVKGYMSKDGYMSVCENGYKRGLYIHKQGSSHYRTNPMFGH